MISIPRHVALLLSICLIAPVAARAAERFETDLLIVGGTESGWAAAIQAARMGVESITIVHDGEWLGGQYTEQALACVDENKGNGKVGWGVDWHPMKRSFHRSGLFKELVDRIESFNEKKYGSAMPGRPYHGPSTFRPAEAEAIFRAMLQPYVDSGQVRFVKSHVPVAAMLADDGRTLTGFRFRSVESEPNRGGELVVSTKLTIDASDWGEAIRLAGAEYECGPDPRSRYDEPSAPTDLSKYPPNEMNPITWAMIVVQSKGESTPIPRPERYDDRNYARTSRISLGAMKGLSWDRPVRLGSIPHWPGAGARKASPRQLSVYNVRRVVDGYTSKEKQTIVLLNYMLGQDYPLERLPRHVVEALERTERGASRKNIVEMTHEQRQIVFDDAKRHALGVLYHLQTFVHDRAPDTTHSFRHFALSDEFGTPDSLPRKPYIRESLRLKAMYTMREQDGRNFDGPTKNEAREAFAKVMYPDGVLCWQFHYDFHRTGRAYLKGEGEAGPWIDFEKPGRHTRFVSDRSVFPLRSLVPVRVDGLLGAQKNVGYSSIVSAAIRLHDQCVHIGQAAGATAAVCLTEKLRPRDVPFSTTHLERVRNGLCGGVGDAVPMLLWPYRDMPTDHPAFVAVSRLGVRRAFPEDRRQVDFRPDDPAEPAWRAATIRRALASKVPGTEFTAPDEPRTRGEFAVALWKHVAKLDDRPLVRVKVDDFDGDGLPDVDDAVPYDVLAPADD